MKHGYWECEPLTLMQWRLLIGCCYLDGSVHHHASNDLRLVGLLPLSSLSVTDHRSHVGPRWSRAGLGNLPSKVNDILDEKTFWFLGNFFLYLKCWQAAALLFWKYKVSIHHVIKDYMSLYIHISMVCIKVVQFHCVLSHISNTNQKKKVSFYCMQQTCIFS